MTKYAQHAIHPEEVATEVAEIRAGIGDSSSVNAFVRSALAAFNSTLRTVEGGMTATTGTLPTGLLDALPPGRPDPITFRDDFPVGRGEAVLHRTDPTVAAVRSMGSELAEPLRPPGPAARSPRPEGWPGDRSG